MGKLRTLTDMINKNWETKLTYRSFILKLKQTSYTSQQLTVSITVNGSEFAKTISLNTTHKWDVTDTKNIVDGIIKEMMEYIFKEDV